MKFTLRFIGFIIFMVIIFYYIIDAIKMKNSTEAYLISGIGFIVATSVILVWLSRSKKE